MKKLFVLVLAVLGVMACGVCFGQYTQHDHWAIYEQVKRTSALGYQGTVQAEGSLLYYWPMQETTGTTLYATKGGTNITVSGATLAQAGQVGTSVNFTGSASSYGVTASSLNLTAYQILAVEALVYWPSFGTGDAMTWEFSTTINSNNGSFNLDTDNSSGVMAAVHGSAGYDYGFEYQPLAAGWHHVVVTYNDTISYPQTTLYIDGIASSPNTLGANSTVTDYFGNFPLYIASRAGSSLWRQMKIQHLAIYSGLSAARILAHAALAGLGPLSHTFIASDETDSGYPSGYANPTWSTLSHVFITTSSDRVIINYTPSIYSLLSAYAQLAYRINGGSVVYPSPSSANSTSYTIEMGNAGTSRSLEVSVGLQAYDYASTHLVLGNFITSVTYGPQYNWGTTTGNIMYVPAPIVGTRLLVYGDSIASGDSATVPMTQSWIGLERNTYSKNVALEGWGYRSLYEDYALNGNSITPLVTQIASYNPSNIILTIGTNDYGLACGGGSGEPPNTWTAAAFQTQYAALVDGLHAALPSAGIYLQTPIYRCSPATEAANCAGNTLGDYRTAINNVYTARSGWAHSIDGTTLCSCGADYSADGVHPSITGHSDYATHLHALGGPF